MDENVQSSAKQLQEAVKQNPSATVIYQLFDSSVYFASSAPGEMVLPKRGADGKFHVIGELVMADWSAFKKIFYAAIPLLCAGGENKKIILSPLPRFSTAKCCPESGHITNYGSKGYGPNMGSCLADIHSWTDDFARGKRIKNFEVVCPSSIIWEDKKTTIKDLKVYWSADPVHLTPKGYEMLAEKLADRVAANQPKKRERSDSEPGNTRQKAGMDTNRRLAGISSSDYVAKRWEKSGAHGGRDGHRVPPRSGNRDGPSTSRH